MSTFENILENLLKKYQQKYGVAVFDIEAKDTKFGIIVNGKVLTENQRDEVLKKLKQETRNKKQGYKIKNNIKVLSDAEKRNEIGWAIVKNKIIDLKSRFVSGKIINEKILKRIRCSQAFGGEILRVLYKHENQLLVQQSDLTLGWVDRNEVVTNKKSLYREWRKGNYGMKNKVLNFKDILKCHSDSLQDKIIKEAEIYLGVKYVLGGKSKKGIDCSGLVQIAYKNSLDIILPKHSWDQKKFGKKIKLENIKTGDLVFLIKKSNKHKHVGIAEVVLLKGAKRLHSSETETMEPANLRDINLIHASLGKKKVVRQKLEEVFESHEFVEARRIAE